MHKEHAKNFRRSSAQPFIPASSARPRPAAEIEVALPIREIYGILLTRIVRPSTSDARRQGALMLSFCA